MNQVTTVTGGRFDLCNPDPWSIELVDIARALSNLCRFTGQIEEFYSVAQHSVICSRLVPDHLQLVALIHDGAEAYTGDINRKVKACLGRSFAMFEAKIEQAVAARFGVCWPMAEQIKATDDRLLMTEHKQYRSGEMEVDDPTRLPPEPFDHIVLPDPWAPKEAYRRFLDRFHEITGCPAGAFASYNWKRPA